jgi:hypothetical protein
MGLVSDNARVDGDVFTVAGEVAEDDEAWRVCEISVDGRVMPGYERKFEGRWAAYCLTPVLIVSVLAPLDLRRDALELRRFHANEIASMDTAYLSDLEERLLELCVEAPEMSAPTTLCEELLREEYDRLVVEAALCGLMGQGLMAISGALEGDDRWVVTDKGRAAIGRRPGRDG